MDFEFFNCTEAVVRWNPTDDDFRSGEMLISRLSPANGEACFDDDRSANSLNSSNLVAEASDIRIRAFNATSEEFPEAENWNAEFSPPPPELGAGSVLLVTPRGSEFNYYLAFSLRRPRVFEGDLTLGSDPYALLMELTVAVPRILFCQSMMANSYSLTLSTFEPEILFPDTGNPFLAAGVGGQTQTSLLGAVLGPSNNDDCDNDDEYLIRTFRTSGLEVLANVNFITLNINVTDPDALPEDPPGIYLLDFRLSSRSID